VQDYFHIPFIFIMLESCQLPHLLASWTIIRIFHAESFFLPPIIPITITALKLSLANREKFQFRKNRLFSRNILLQSNRALKVLGRSIKWMMHLSDISNPFSTNFNHFHCKAKLLCLIVQTVRCIMLPPLFSQNSALG
jgi:hypothetical protein